MAIYNKKFDVGTDYQLTISVLTENKIGSIEIHSKPIFNPISKKMESQKFGIVFLDDDFDSMDDFNFEIFRKIFHWFGRSITRQQVKVIDDFLSQFKEG